MTLRLVTYIKLDLEATLLNAWIMNKNVNVYLRTLADHFVTAWSLLKTAPFFVIIIIIGTNVDAIVGGVSC